MTALRAEAPPPPRLTVAGPTVWSAAPLPPDAQLAKPARRSARTAQPDTATRARPVATALRAEAPPRLAPGEGFARAVTGRRRAPQCGRRSHPVATRLLCTEAPSRLQPGEVSAQLAEPARRFARAGQLSTATTVAAGAGCGSVIARLDMTAGAAPW